MLHTFHIPVLGLGYSIDTPLKVSRYGISSVLSIVDDDLIERVHGYHCRTNNLPYTPILKTETDSRAKRIKSYLNFLADAINKQFEDLKQLDFEKGNDLCRYFEFLPSGSSLRNGYELMMDEADGIAKERFKRILKQQMKMGAIDVNIMAKVDRMAQAVPTIPDEVNSDALAALRGFAESKLQSSLVLSAGMNPRLYQYISTFPDFFPDTKGVFRKKIILKVSDFRSAIIQAKFLAKKGLWVSEFRIESGLNCGGHAFATAGYLLGPILEEFKQKRKVMLEELFNIYTNTLGPSTYFAAAPAQRITAQGGIGTAEEHQFLLRHYGLDAIGWGSPFLLVPEVTNVDHETLVALQQAKADDFYLSNASPLGIQFNNFKNSSSEKQRLVRIKERKPGSPCTKKLLCTNTEFTDEPICTASRKYQHQKIKQLQSLDLSEAAYQKEFDFITEKICLCEGLCTSTYLKYKITKPKTSTAVAICPGPNLAYFSSNYLLEEMVAHIYGRLDLLENVNRPHVFIKEISLYMAYLQGEFRQLYDNFSAKKKQYTEQFRDQLQQGIAYYRLLFIQIALNTSWPINEIQQELHHFSATLATL
ncbi:hypothetical protein [Pedobacter sandarakinus]|uniref:hypothetical protein n=1 Tax=Pedobacter sandarakinus TaxID=353156 RepID=UPI00224872F4|nr:hypothetical protein [Pedobacter sandarakinus]MCX2574918.1 hypothetical protein [Pedobacter sandarakinus]